MLLSPAEQSLSQQQPHPPPLLRLVLRSNPKCQRREIEFDFMTTIEDSNVPVGLGVDLGSREVKFIQLVHNVTYDVQGGNFVTSSA